MKVFFDTSVLIAAVNAEHAHHAKAFPLLERVQEGRDEGFVSAHSLAEMYAILTRLPVPFRHSPEQALLSIEENVLNFFKVTALTVTDYSALLRDSAVRGVHGGTIYDALLLKCASKVAVERIFTFNLRHFQALATRITHPLIVAP